MRAIPLYCGADPQSRRYVGAQCATQAEAGSWPGNRPDAVCQEDIPCPRSPTLGQATVLPPHHNRRSITARVASRRAAGVDATPVPVLDRYAPCAAGKTGSRGNQTKTLPKRREGTARSKGQLRHHAGATPRLVLGSCWSRAAGGLRTSSIDGADCVGGDCSAHHPSSCFT